MGREKQAPDVKYDFDLERWRASVMDDWQAIVDVRARLEDERVEGARDQLIHSARLRRATAEFERVEHLVDVADALLTITERLSGKLYLRIEDMEIAFEWNT